MKTRKRIDDDEEDLTPDALARVALQTEIEELRARVSELEDWFARYTCAAAARAGRDLATGRQLRYIRGLAKRTGADASGIARDQFGVEELPALTREQASELIGSLQSLQPDKE